VTFSSRDRILSISRAHESWGSPKFILLQAIGDEPLPNPFKLAVFVQEFINREVDSLFEDLNEVFPIWRSCKIIEVV